MSDPSPPTLIINNDDITMQSNKSNRTNVISNNAFMNKVAQKTGRKQRKLQFIKITKGKILDKIQLLSLWPLA